MLGLNAVWEALALSSSFVRVVTGNTGPMTKEEAVAAMLWNAFFASLCLSIQRVTWT